MAHRALVTGRLATHADSCPSRPAPSCAPPPPTRAVLAELTDPNGADATPAPRPSCSSPPTRHVEQVTPVTPSAKCSADGALRQARKVILPVFGAETGPSEGAGHGNWIVKVADSGGHIP